MTSAAAARAAEAARIVVEGDAVYTRTRGDPFFFTSGWASPIFVDIKQLVSRRAARDALIRLAVEAIETARPAGSFDLVAGCELVGIPFAAIIADRLGLPFVVVRKQGKGFGRLAHFEGTFEAGARTLLVDDVSTDGVTKATFRAALERADARVVEIFVLLDYGIFPSPPASRPLASLMRLADVIAAVATAGRLSAAAQAELVTFASDAPAWSRRNGGIGGVLTP